MNKKTQKELTTDECLEIFKQYDQFLYHYYMNNMWYFGCDARNYAMKLKNEHEKVLCEEET